MVKMINAAGKMKNATIKKSGPNRLMPAETIIGPEIRPMLCAKISMPLICTRWASVTKSLICETEIGYRVKVPVSYTHLRAHETS